MDELIRDCQYVYTVANVMNRAAAKRFAKDNPAIIEDENDYIWVKDGQLEAVLNDVKRNSLVYKSGVLLLCLSVLTTILMSLGVFIFGLFADENILLCLALSFAAALLPALSLIVADGIRRGGMWGFFKMLCNVKIRLEEQGFLYSYVSLEPETSEEWAKLFAPTRYMKYKDIKRITYNKELRRIEIVGKYYERMYFTPDGVRTLVKTNEYKDCPVRDKSLVIGNAFSNGNVIALIAKRSNKQIQEENKKDVRKPADFVACILLYLFLGGSVPICTLFTLL